MRWIGANERTVKKLARREEGPRGEHLLALFRHSNVVLEIVVKLVGLKFPVFPQSVQFSS